MSDIKYGLISKTDANVLEKTIDLICDGMPLGGIINTCEVGVYSGATSAGIFNYIENKCKLKSEQDGYEFKAQAYRCKHIGIDNKKDGEEIKHFPKDGKLIIGNSNEVYNQVEDNSQHLIFQDSCHCFACTVSAFFCYAPKVKPGGYMAFHDTGTHIKPFKDFQHGDKENPDAYISCRKALAHIGVLDGVRKRLSLEAIADEWDLVFDEADPTNEAGGICVFKKID